MLYLGAMQSIVRQLVPFDNWYSFTKGTNRLGAKLYISKQRYNLLMIRCSCLNHSQLPVLTNQQNAEHKLVGDTCIEKN